MSGSGVSIRYARALLELGIEDKKTDKLQEELTALGEAYQQSRELQVVLTNPSIKLEERKSLISHIAKSNKISALMTNFVLLLLDKERIDSLPLIARHFQRMADEVAGRVRAEVVSARPLSAAQVSRMKSMLSKRTGKEVILETAQDAELLGGVVTRIDGKIYDGSLRTQLKALRHAVGAN